jgi:hypothetical protein
MNKNFSTWFHWQCDFLGFQASKKMIESILLENWPKNEYDKEDDAYEILTFSYS